VLAMAGIGVALVVVAAAGAFSVRARRVRRPGCSRTVARPRTSAEDRGRDG
jgi:hypothetical protein